MIGKDDNSLGALLHDVAHALRMTIDRAVEPHNLTRAKWLALGILSRREGLTQAELANELELGAATVGRLVERLEARGFVERKPDPVDARVKRLFVKNEARSELDALEKVSADVRKSALKGISSDEQATLAQLLRRMKQNLGAMLCTVGVAWCSRLSTEVHLLCA